MNSPRKIKPHNLPRLSTELSEAGRQQLRQWLQGGMTYDAARARLQSDYGITISTATICKFYHRHCVASEAKSEPGNPVLLDVVITKESPGDAVRVKILQKTGGVQIIQ